MKNSKLALMQSISEQQEQSDQLEQSLQQLSKTLNNFETLIAQSEQPIINSTTLLNNIQHTTQALESHLSAIMTQIQPQVLKTQITGYIAQIETLQTQLTQIDTTEISKVKTSIDQFSVSIDSLQKKIDHQIQNLSINQLQLQQNIQAQVQQAMMNQSPQIQNDIQTLIREQLDTQKAKFTLWGIMGFAALILLIVLYLGWQMKVNYQTIEAQREIIQFNRQGQ